MLEGPPETEVGYYDLEEHERNQSWVALNNHADAFALWYRALTLYREAMLGTWHFKDVKPGSIDLASLGLQMQLLGLGVCAAKSSVDDLAAGYYSQAFGGIRHMLETFIQCMYVSFNPDQAKLWYEQEGGISEQVDPPSMKTMCQAISAEPAFAHTGVKDLVDKIYNSWQLMSKGAHPSGVGITQTMDPETNMGLIGATYREDLCLAGLDIGLFAVGTLIPQALRMAKPEIGTWSKEWAELSKRIGDWRSTNELKLRAGEGMRLDEQSVSAIPKPVPQVSPDDVRRCYKLINLHQAEMNHMRRPS